MSGERKEVKSFTEFTFKNIWFWLIVVILALNNAYWSGIYWGNLVGAFIFSFLIYLIVYPIYRWYKK